MPKANVKIMLSYDYCHFEICLGSDKNQTLKQINKMRKDCQKLADEAVRQYQKAKKYALMNVNIKSERKRLENDIFIISKKPKSEWNAEEKAKVKALNDKEYWEQYDYDYYDDEDDIY